ncbi:FAD binding domain-containing protein [Immersiella caudata]|uniref:FAD binding domain-containing protein n=1 Tax=Immersiella caudata TaxID=314043 RepID=A0AA39WSF2_9PEZI|nr:FAD binding domain-containing protein [Immersiella caudata]
MLRYLPLFLASSAAVTATNFNWEKLQLSRNETALYPDIDFGNLSGPNATYTGPKCKVSPSDPSWPTPEEWARLNTTLSGALLKPSPPAAVCYPGATYNSPTCDFITLGNRTRYHLDHPVGVLTEWTGGSTCVVPPRNPAPSSLQCNQGAFPVYVVNATTVKQIQIAVNFARNRNLRLVIKNTGHDFNGRSTGYGALQVWTHHLKDFEYIPEATVGEYTGRVAKVSAGIEMWEVFNHMGTYNMTMPLPGGETVGVFGGWTAGGGHHFLSSLYGNGADQVLEFKVVTADGRYRTVTPFQNGDLYFAMLGGGGSTYGILTSALVKAYPKTEVTDVNLEFFYRESLPANTTSTPSFPVTNDLEKFWDGVWLYQKFSRETSDAGGSLYSYVRPDRLGLNFSVIIKLPLKNIAQAAEFTKPLYDDLNKLGFPVKVNPVPNPDTQTQNRKAGVWGGPGNSFFGSRLIPRTNWDNNTIFNKTFHAVLRLPVELGLIFHGVDHYAPLSKIGYPAQHNSITPAWRQSIMHVDIMDREFTGFSTTSAKDFLANHADRLHKAMGPIRDVTPGSGAYYNEADVMEPNWQSTFFGPNYSRLSRIKRARDPWGLFWAPTTPGSEYWKVVTENDLPTQNGPLCQTGFVDPSESLEEEEKKQGGHFSGE